MATPANCEDGHKTGECLDLYSVCPDRFDCPLYLESIGFMSADEAEAEAWRDVPVEILDNED